MKKLLMIGLGLLVIAAIGFAVLPSRELNVPSSATHEFQIDAPMERVRKVLVRTNAVKKIVAMADAKLLDQEWLNLDFDINRPLLKRDWHVDGEGQLVVESNNAYLGTHEMTLNQSVDIKRDRLYVENDLDQPSGPIREYSATLELVPGDDGEATVKSSLKLNITTTANWFTSSIVESSIKKSALDSLKNQEQAIRQVVDDHAYELIVLPQASNE